jgi:hypothetical protein
VKASVRSEEKRGEARRSRSGLYEAVVQVVDKCSLLRSDEINANGGAF